MNDVFVEQIVERKQDLSTSVKKILLILAAVLVSTVFLVIGVIRFIFPAVFALCFAVRTSRNLNLEYSTVY